jgi:hypothetical protein
VASRSEDDSDKILSFGDALDILNLSILGDILDMIGASSYNFVVDAIEDDGTMRARLDLRLVGPNGNDEVLALDMRWINSTRYHR